MGQDGCERMVLDTVAPLEAAVALYRKLGFQEIEPHYHNPFEDVIYFGIELNPPNQVAGVHYDVGVRGAEVGDRQPS